MKIIYYNPTCGSGIEQIGYVYMLLLKKLGHEIELWNTQGIDIREKLNKRLEKKDYDAILLNSVNKKEVADIFRKPKGNVFAITHTSEPLPEFIVRLSLNYLYQYRYFYKKNSSNLMLPITYPYNYKDIKFKKERKYDFVFVGRWTKSKFDPKVKNFLKKSNIKIDKAYISKKEQSVELIKDYEIKASLDKVYKLLSNSKYLLLPSTTECISLVAGEALVNGCIPVVYETNEKIHEQFFNCITCHSMNDFNEKIMELKNKKIDNQKRKRIFNFSNRMWSKEKSLKELKLIFREGKRGKIIKAHDDYKHEKEKPSSYRKGLPFKNAKLLVN